jgi:hypothetical protein
MNLAIRRLKFDFLRPCPGPVASSRAPASWTAPVLWRFSRIWRTVKSGGGLPHSRTLRDVRSAALGLFLVALFIQPSLLHSQPAPPPNRVLQLDGTNSFVQLPANIFDSLTQATVEG